VNALEVRRLSVRFPTRLVPALKEVSCGLERGETVVLAGRSGSGKSTLLHTALGYIPEGVPAEVDGEILLGGVPASPGLARRGRRLGLVQQDPEAGLCTLRVRDEVAFGPENLGLSRREIAARVERALSATGLAPLAERATWSLSGGEKQRTALAAALALEPEVLLLDEPTAHLDPQGAQDLLYVLSGQVTDGRGVLLAEHRLGPLQSLRPRVVRLDVDEPIREEFFNTCPAPSGAAAVDARDLRFSYPGGNELLGGLSFAVAPGEVLGVVGPNGSGKSTLLRLLAGLTAPERGTVRVGGRDPAALRPTERRGLVGMVTQMPHHQLFAPTVAQEFSLDEVSADAMDRWLERAQLQALSAEHPLRLSIGERRRLTMALALAGRPRVLLLDEPFIGQDRENAAWVARRISEASRMGVAVVLVSHRLPLLARLAHRVLFLGRRTHLGPTDEVFGELRREGQQVFTPEFWEEQW